MKILNEIQQQLKAPKTQRNTFGGYMYRSCEDILEAVKPLLKEAILTFQDEIVYIASTPTQQFSSPTAKEKQYDVDGSRFYIKATVTLRCGTESISVSAYAREPLAKKGMDEMQVTGATSSYARKYALNGLFCIDDSRDSDSAFNENEEEVKPAKPNKKQQEVIDAIFDELDKVAPEGKMADKVKIGILLFMSKGKYPDDIKKAPNIAAWLVTNKMAEIYKDAE